MFFVAVLLAGLLAALSLWFVAGSDAGTADNGSESR